MHGHNYELLIAECLSMKLLILQCVFSVGGVWCPASGMQFVTLRNAIKGVACAQASVPFRNAIKRSCLQKLVNTYVKFIVLSAVVALAVSLLRRQNTDGSEKERARSLA